MQALTFKRRTTWIDRQAGGDQREVSKRQLPMAQGRRRRGRDPARRAGRAPGRDRPCRHPPTCSIRSTGRLIRSGKIRAISPAYTYEAAYNTGMSHADVPLPDDLAHAHRVIRDLRIPVSYTHLRAHETDSYLV